MNHSTYKNTLPKVSLAFLAAFALLITMTLPSSASAAQDEHTSPAVQILDRFFQWRDSSSSSSVFELLPEDLLEGLFDGSLKPGVGNDTTDPEIDTIETEADENSISVNWETDEKTRGTLYLSTSTPLDTDDEDTIQVDTHRRWKTDHEVTATELDADTTYYAVIEARDKAGNTTMSEEFTVTTDDDTNDDEDTQAPTITDIEATSTASTIAVMWNTDEEADSELFLSTDSPVDLDATTTIHIHDEDAVDEHELHAEDLDADTTYYGVIRSTDLDGNTRTSSTFEIDTQSEADTNAPTLSDIAFDTSTSTIDISWTTNEEAQSAVYTSTSSGFALDDDDVMVTSDDTFSTTHALSVTGLQEAMTYYHRLVSTDADDNQTISTQFTISTN